MKIDEQKVREYFNNNLKDSEIARLLNCSKDGIYLVRKRLNLVRNFKFSEGYPIKLTKLQEEVLIGHILGDGSISQDSLNARVKIEQGEKQKDYAYWKYNIFENLTNKFLEFNRTKVDTRNNKLYKSYGCTLRANPELNKYFNLFYKNKKKIISNEILDLYTNISLAVHFMDDGYKTKHSYGLSTNCFTDDDLKIFRDFLWNKFKLETSVHQNNRLYIKSGSKRLFEELITPFIIESMKYKLHNYSLVIPLNGEYPMARTIPC